METGKSGYFELTGTKAGITARIDWSEVFDSVGNTSDLSVIPTIKSSSYYGYTYWLTGTVTVDGVQIAEMSSSLGSHYLKINALNTYASIAAASGYTAPPWTRSGIAHATDGSKTVTIAVEIQGFTTDGSGGNGWKVSGSKAVELTAIPRASTIGATDANIGAVSMIAVNKKSSAYTHSIAYQFGSLSGYITESGGVSSSEAKFSATSVAFTVPTAFYNQIPVAKSGVCTLTIKTYSGSTQIGDAQTCTFTVTASESACKPTVSGTVVDSNETTKALTGDENTLVRYFSTALCTIVAQAKNGASISAKKIGGTAVSGTTRSIANVETGKIAFYAADSRGYEASCEVEKTLIPYVKLTLNPTAARTDPTSGNATLTLKGDCFDGSFGAVANGLEIQYRVDSGEYVTIIPTVTDGSYAVNIDLSGLDYQSTHIIEITASDKLMTVSKTVKVEKGIPLADWGENDFRFNVPVSFMGGAVFSTTNFRCQSDSDDDESALNAWLDGILSGLPNYSIVPAAIACYPAFGTGRSYYGLLCQHYSGYAVFVGWTYDSTMIRKIKSRGSWADAVIS